MIEKLLEMKPIEKKTFFRSLEFYDPSFDADARTASVNETWEDARTALTDAIMTADNVGELVKDSRISDMIHVLRWMYRWGHLSWDDLTDLLDDLRNAVVERISAEA